MSLSCWQQFGADANAVITFSAIFAQPCKLVDAELAEADTLV